VQKDFLFSGKDTVNKSRFGSKRKANKNSIARKIQDVLAGAAILFSPPANKVYKPHGTVDYSRQSGTSVQPELNAFPA
jgi:hypothetical protein